MGILNRLRYHLGKSWSHNSAALTTYSERFLGETPTASAYSWKYFTIIPAASPALGSAVPSSFLAHSLTVIFPFTLQIRAHLGMSKLHLNPHFRTEAADEEQEHSQHQAANPRLLLFVWQTNPPQEKSSAHLVKTFLKKGEWIRGNTS